MLSLVLDCGESVMVFVQFIHPIRSPYSPNHPHLHHIISSERLTLSLGPAQIILAPGHQTHSAAHVWSTHHFFFCFFAPVAAGAMMNVDVGCRELSLFFLGLVNRFSLYKSRFSLKRVAAALKPSR